MHRAREDRMTDLDRALRDMTHQDLLALGVSHVAYVRAWERQGETVYVVHGADGTELAVLASLEAARAVIREHDMDLVTLH